MKTSLPSNTGTKASRLAIAKGRVEFWTLWALEASDTVAKAYFDSRLRHWQHTKNSVEMEPEPL